MTKEISLLRLRMRDDMALRNMSPGLQSADVRRCTSVVGTFETCRRTVRMSAYWGRPEVTGRRVKTSLLTHSGHSDVTRVG